MTRVVIDVPDTDLGPHMSALNEKQRAFVFALVETGGNATQAAKAAGYGAESATQEQRDNAARMRGYQLSHDKRVLSAIKEEAEKRLHSGALIAASALLEIVNDPLNKNRLRAAESLLDRAGLIVPSQVNIKHHHSFDNRSDAEITTQIMQRAAALGLDGKALLGQIIRQPEPVDAEFTVVDEDQAGSSAGLEDLL